MISPVKGHSRTTEFNYNSIPKSMNAEKYLCFYCNGKKSLEEFIDIEKSLMNQDAETIELILECLPDSSNPLCYPFMYHRRYFVGELDTLNICKNCYTEALRKFRNEKNS